MNYFERWLSRWHAREHLDIEDEITRQKEILMKLMNKKKIKKELEEK